MSGRVLITGGTGQLGDSLARLCLSRELEFRAPGREDLDITDRDLVASAVRDFRPDVIFNCAAFHQLDRCEENPGLATRVNLEGVVNLRDAAADGPLLVHVSTNYVFDGKRPLAEGGYTEDDAPNPAQEYGRSKLAGEEELGDDCLVVRTAGLFGRGGAASKGGSFVERMLARDDDIRMVADQYVNPTSTEDLAPAMLQCWEEGMTGTVHLVNSGGCSWLEFTAEILLLAGHDNVLEPVETDPEAIPRRPLNGLLETVRDAPEMPSWQEALGRYLSDQSG